MSCPFHDTSSGSKSSQKPKDHPEIPSSPSSPSITPSPSKEIPPSLPIPQPPIHFLTKNLPEIDATLPIASFWRLADLYGPIYQLNLVKRRVVVISNHALINEVCDDRFYEKYVTGTLEEVRTFVKNGLFTSYSSEPEWGIAHRTLVPAFGPLHIRSMFPSMVDILSQMILRWDRFGPSHTISTMDDFTRLAFDVIGLCAFNYRFNAFYGEDLIPFAKQLGEVLIETGKRTNRLEISNQVLHRRDTKHMMDNIHAMWKVCDDIVAERRANPKPEVHDILNVMLTAKDPVTGQGFTDENIRYQMATFLVAGHDTSAGTMMFLFYNLLQHPEALQKCYAEVDQVLGDRGVTMADIPRLKYIEASMRETLRFLGPIAAITRHAKETRLLAGKYKVTPEDAIMINFKGLHHDPAVWGDDADEFRPDRFLNGGWEKLPANCWKPFGTGVRACIGRYLAEQEIVLTLAMVLQRFVVEMAEPEYKLKIKSTLTIKPDDFKIKVRRRPGKDHLFVFSAGGEPSMPSSVPNTTITTPANGAPSAPETDALEPISVFYGGNTGTCKSFGEDLSSSAPNFGLVVPQQVQNLDEAVENLPTDQPVVIITSSYEGLPPDNARGFVAWLEREASNLSSSSNHQQKPLEGVKYAVFGVGNKDWVTTYFRIPKRIDELMNLLGATRLVSPGFVDVSEDIIGPFDEWKTTSLFPALREATGITETTPVNEKANSVVVEILPPKTPSRLAGEDVSEGLVLENKVIAARGSQGPEKRQIDILLLVGVEYQSGDYLAVQPYNPRDSVTRVLRRFGLHADDLVVVSGTNKEHLLSHSGTDSSPTPISAFELLSTRVELANPASQRQIATLANNTQTPTEADRLRAFASDDTLYRSQILAKRFAVLDLLEDFPSCALPLADYLDMLAPLTPRQYSISSSPLAQQQHREQKEGQTQEDTALVATLTYDVHAAPSLSHPSSQTFHGVASSHLASLRPGSKVRCFVRHTQIPFHLPKDPKTPVIMIAAGTGIAPMRAFLQDRAAIAAARPGGAKENLGPAVLYYGCRDHDGDFLYREELKGFVEQGVVEVRAPFSKSGPADTAEEGDASWRMETGSHVDAALWRDRGDLRDLFDHGARILVCGSAARLGRSTADVCLRIYGETHPETTQEEREAWLAKMKEDRYVSDVFG